MARTVQDAKIGTREARRKLKASGKPYYRGIDRGLHIGYRKGKTGGVWVMRWYVGDEAYKVETIGAADDNLDADGRITLDFSQAQAKARELFECRKRRAAGLPVENGPYTVRHCVEDYLQWMESARKTAADARYRTNALILPALGHKECAALTTGDLENWLSEVAKAPKRVRTRAGEKQRFGPSGDDVIESVRRRRASANRTLTILKAALNRAWRAGKIASDDAWRRLEPFEEVNAARVRYLTIAEAQRLINGADVDFRRLVRAGLATGCRYGELAALNVEDFNQDSDTLHVRASKSGKARHVVLSEEGAALFTALAAGRPGAAPMLTRGDGDRWLKSHQARPMADACARAKIDPLASFHVLRHTYASHAIMNGAPLIIVAKNLGHSDTRMVEKHYGHLAPSYIADAIRAAAPRFGMPEANVEPIVARRRG
jgi:integrase